MAKCYCPNCDIIIEMPVVIVKDLNGNKYKAYEHKCSENETYLADKSLEDLCDPERIQIAAKAGKEMAGIIADFYHALDKDCTQ